MEAERLKALAEQYPEVSQLLKDNHSMSVAVLAGRMDSWQQKMETRLHTFDANHTRAQAELVDRIMALEKRVENASKVVSKIRKQLKEKPNDEAEEKEATTDTAK